MSTCSCCRDDGPDRVRQGDEAGYGHVDLDDHAYGSYRDSDDLCCDLGHLGWRDCAVRHHRDEVGHEKDPEEEPAHSGLSVAEAHVAGLNSGPTAAAGGSSRSKSYKCCSTATGCGRSSLLFPAMLSYMKVETAKSPRTSTSFCFNFEPPSCPSSAISALPR